MARQVLAIEAMTDYARGVTTTVGLISGGTAPNIVPQHCRFAVDLRVETPPTARSYEAAIMGLAAVRPGREDRGCRRHEPPAVRGIEGDRRAVRARPRVGG